MKTKGTGQTNLMAGGKERLENTNDFKRKKENINKEVRGKYALTLLNERNWVKRTVLVFKREIEIRRRIAELSSLKNLHTAHLQQM